jgi:hypothetical protein
LHSANFLSKSVKIEYFVMFQEMKNDDRILNTCLSLNKLCASREEPNGPLKPSEYTVHFIHFACELRTRRCVQKYYV